MNNNNNNNNNSHSDGTHSIKPARLIRADGTEQPINPRDGKYFTFPELYPVFNCTNIELVVLPNGNVMLGDEDAKLTDKPRNKVATAIAANLRPDDLIAGDVVVCDPRQLVGATEEQDLSSRYGGPTTEHAPAIIEGAKPVSGKPSGEPRRATMNGKPVFEIPAKTVINFHSGFAEKLLCTGPCFSAGISCAYRCGYCFVKALMRRQKPYHASHGVVGEHEDVVIRRNNAVARLRAQLTDRSGHPKYKSLNDRRVIYGSPFVDVAANMELVHETISICRELLQLTNWTVRLLSKSNLLPLIARALPEVAKERVIYGVSTGTLNDELARAFEEGTPRISKRITSLRWLQDNGFRTFAMFCPSLPQRDYDFFARELHEAVRADRCEHVWAEVLNVRGPSMESTTAALKRGGFHEDAALLKATEDQALWENYARATFLAHAPLYPPGKLRFLQYVTKKTRSWWAQHQHAGAVLLGAAAKEK